MSPNQLLPPVSVLQRAPPEMSAVYYLSRYHPNLNLSYYPLEGNLVLGTCSMFVNVCNF